ncbi:MAG: SHOCT domain-containing protein [Actinomycetota bacterium]|nr:SHOCT domain-containing protein [Actinomycetota bacterium]
MIVAESPFFVWYESWWWILGILQALFWIGVLVVGVNVLFRRRPQGRSAGVALRILEERYARGEIAREEYLERRAVLEDTKSPT